MTPAEMVREFHQAFGIPIADVPTVPTSEVRELRAELIREETHGVLGEIWGRHHGVVHVAAELADLAYVVYGTALAYGIDLDAVIAAVHAANMSKLQSDGTPLLRADGKVLKSENFVPADIAAVLGIEAAA